MKTIIVYASTYGFTKDCAEKLKEQLQGEVLLANVASDSVPSLGGFDNIIIGGSIYMGKIQKKLNLFCSKNLDTLLEKHIALFLCCGSSENFNEALKNNFPQELIKKSGC